MTGYASVQRRVDLQACTVSPYEFDHSEVSITQSALGFTAEDHITCSMIAVRLKLTFCIIRTAW